MSPRKKCATCKFWWPNTTKAVVAGVKRNGKHPCLRQPGKPQLGGMTVACRSHKKFKSFYMVPWDEKTWIKIEAESREEMLEKAFGIARRKNRHGQNQTHPHRNQPNHKGLSTVGAGSDGPYLPEGLVLSPASRLFPESPRDSLSCPPD